MLAANRRKTRADVAGERGRLPRCGRNSLPSECHSPQGGLHVRPEALGGLGGARSPPCHLSAASFWLYATRRSSRSRAAPESMDCAASATPPLRSAARPPATSAAE